MGFLYYLPGMSRIPSLDELQTRGLGYAFEQPPEACGVTSGPDGGSGMIASQTTGSTSDRIGYYPDQQRWLEVPKNEGGPPHPYWIGMYENIPPTPTTLARERQLIGHFTRLADGQNWLIPAARMAPKTYVYTSGAGWISASIEAYSWLWPEAERIWASYANSHDDADADGEIIVEVDTADVDLAARLLSLNYRVGPHEVSMLALLSTQIVPAVMLALLDWPTLKKKLTSPLAGSAPG